MNRATLFQFVIGAPAAVRRTGLAGRVREAERLLFSVGVVAFAPVSSDVLFIFTIISRAVSETSRKLSVIFMQFNTLCRLKPPYKRY